MAKKTVANVGHGPFDRAILAGFSANQSAEEVSASHPINGTLSPAQVLDRLYKLLESKDILDVQQKRALIVDNAYELAAKLRKQIDGMEFIPHEQAGMYLKTLKELMLMLDSANAQIEEAMLKFNARRAQELTQALIYIFTSMMKELTREYPEIDTVKAQEIVMLAIPEAMPEVQ